MGTWFVVMTFCPCGDRVRRKIKIRNVFGMVKVRAGRFVFGGCEKLGVFQPGWDIEGRARLKSNRLGNPLCLCEDLTTHVHQTVCVCVERQEKVRETSTSLGILCDASCCILSMTGQVIEAQGAILQQRL